MRRGWGLRLSGCQPKRAPQFRAALIKKSKLIKKTQAGETSAVLLQPLTVRRVCTESTSTTEGRPPCVYSRWLHLEASLHSSVLFYLLNNVKRNTKTKLEFQGAFIEFNQQNQDFTIHLFFALWTHEALHKPVLQRMYISREKHILNKISAPLEN